MSGPPSSESADPAADRSPSAPHAPQSVAGAQQVATTDDWRPACGLLALQTRAAMLRAARQFFDARGYLEVETPLLSRDVVVDAHLHPFVVPTDSGPRYLQTSPEAGMKRLLAAGTGSIYQITRSFRRGEFGEQHNPEFTMIEWYGTGSDHHQQMQLTEQLVRTCLDAAAGLTGRPHPALAAPEPFGRISYDEAFERALGQRVVGCAADVLQALAVRSGTPLPESLDVQETDDLLNLLLAIHVEPTLGRQHPEFLYDYPATQAALARLSPRDGRLAERFELYIQGVELCNGYHELTDPEELRARDQLQNQRRRQQQAAELPGAARMLQAMHFGLPNCSGVALGFDRLVMLALQTTAIADVLPFPFDRA